MRKRQRSLFWILILSPLIVLGFTLSEFLGEGVGGWGAFVVGTSTFALVGGLIDLLVKRRQPKPGHCPACGYDLRATPDRCPECGLRAPPVQNPPHGGSTA